jgi:glycosyltransferase involved in cell wall biosynthesis
MIYADVTSACLLPLQSGIPRMTRGVYRLLVDHAIETEPLFWQPFRYCYTELSPRARKLLDDPFMNRLSTKTPRDSTLPLLWASFSDFLGPWPNTVPLTSRLRADDTLLLTSIFPDNRLGYLQRLLSAPGRKIAIFHDAIPLRDPNVAGWEKKRHILTLRLLARMDEVIAVSTAARKELESLWTEYGIASRASITAIPWPVPFTGARPEFSGPPAGRKRLLYVSRLKQVKNHLTLFDACRLLWKRGLEFELELIGCGDEAQESRAITKTVDQLRAEGKPVSWRGQVTEEELHEAYRCATFTVFPSLAEGFGLPIIESFWHGRPVVCGEEGAVGELSRNGGCLTVDVRDSGQMAEAMGTLLRDGERCQVLSREAYNRPLRSWGDYWEELKPILEKR